ncbi:MAG: YIP1 family protein [Anaerolineae bacterium]|nr:YIP1 family protein [Anaerolineae bacterium]
MESSQSISSAHLVRSLAPETSYPERIGAARALGEVETSDVSIVRALLAAKERDPSYQVRQAAAEAVRAPVHADVLAQHPELQPAVDAGVRHSAPAVGATAAVDMFPASDHPADERSAASPLISWLTIWIWPRRTIRQIVDVNPRYGFLPLVVLAGWARAIDTSSSRSAGDTMSLGGILATVAILGPVGWLIGVYVGAAFLRFIGARLGGEAESEEVRAALAWSALPSVTMLPVFALLVAVLGLELFQSDMPSVETNLLFALGLAGAGLLALVASLWQIVLNVLTIAEVHRFSIWRSLTTWLVFGLVMLGPIVCVIVASSGWSVTP